MKTKQLAAGITLIFSMAASTLAMAERAVSYDYGTVIDAEPIVKHIRVSTPREECWDEEVSYTDRRNSGGLSTVIGAVVGGAIGNAVGHKKRNKQVGAVLGAVLGGTIGNTIGKSRRQGRTYTETEEVCKVYTDYREEERIVGYNVRYRYNNDTYTTRTDRDPGDTIKLRVAVTPVI